MPNGRPGGEDRNEHIEKMLEDMQDEIKELIKDYFELYEDNLVTHFDERINTVVDSVTELVNRPDETQKIKDRILDLEHGVEEIKYNTSFLEGLGERLTNLEVAIEENELKNDERMHNLEEAVGNLEEAVANMLEALRRGPDSTGA